MRGLHTYLPLHTISLLVRRRHVKFLLMLCQPACHVIALRHRLHVGARLCVVLTRAAVAVPLRRSTVGIEARQAWLTVSRSVWHACSHVAGTVYAQSLRLSEQNNQKVVLLEHDRLHLLHYEGPSLLTRTYECENSQHFVL